MSYFSETYLADFRPRILDFISNHDSSDNVSDVALEHANRAQKNLWMKKPWDDLAVEVDVILVSNSYALPSDFGRVIWLYANLDGTGAAGYLVWNSLDYDGYKIRDVFTKASVHSLTLSFNYDQTDSIKMIYQKVLPDFTGSGNEYLFFPANIMLLEAEKINLREKGDLKELAAANSAFDFEFKEFANSRQWVNQNPTGGFRDGQGNKIVMQSYSLNGETSRNNTNRLDAKTLYW